MTRADRLAAIRARVAARGSTNNVVVSELVDDASFLLARGDRAAALFRRHVAVETQDDGVFLHDDILAFLADEEPST